MTILNFEKSINKTILERGQSYFTNRAVSSIEETDPGCWVATVEGSEPYEVSVVIKKQTITEWDCTCPYVDGPVCKHTVAVLYTIADELKKTPASGKKKKAATPTKDIRKTVEQILEKASKEEVAKFIVGRFRNDRTLKSAFLTYFADLLEGDSSSKYTALVESILQPAMGKGLHYGLDYAAEKRIEKALIQLVKRAEDILAKNDISESLTIAKALLETVASAAYKAGYYAGFLGDTLNRTVALIQTIIDKAPPLLQDDLFEYIIQQAGNQEHVNIHLTVYKLLEIALDSTTDSHREKQLFDTFDKLEAEWNKYKPNSGAILSLISMKLQYFEARGRKEEFWALVEKNKHHPNFRERLIVEAIRTNDLVTAKALCHEGIKIEKGSTYPATEEAWKELLLVIAVTENSLPDIRKLAEDRFFHTHGTMRYYQLIKTTYSADEWPSASQKIIDRIRAEDTGRKYGYWDNELANIFAEEEDADSLIALLEKHHSNLQFISNYAPYVSDTHPDIILALYEKGIATYAQQLGRTAYENLAAFLMSLASLPGGEEKMQEIVLQLRTQYYNRKAMLEIFDRVLPETIGYNKPNASSKN